MKRLIPAVTLLTIFIIGNGRLLIAQEQPTHSISELNVLLQKSKSDSESVALLLETALVYILRRGEERADMDSGLYFANKGINLSNKMNAPLWQARCFLVYSNLYREDNQKDKGKNYIEKAIAIFAHYNQKESLGDAYMELQMYYDVYSDSGWVFKAKYANMAEQLYKQNGSKLKQAATLKELGDFYQIKEKDSIALTCLYQSLAIYKSINYGKVQGVYDLIGIILYYGGDYNQALKYGLLAVETAERLKTGKQELTTIYNRVGLTYFRLTQFRESNSYFKKALSIAIENKDTFAARMIVPNLTSTYLRLGNQQELLALLQKVKFIKYDKGDLIDKATYNSYCIQAYLLNDNIKDAAPFVRELIRVVRDTTNINVLRSLHMAVIPYYLAAGQYKEMYKYLPVNDSICKKLTLFPALADNYLWWFKADSATGNDAAAIAHYKLYKTASDSSLSLTANQQVNQLMIQYESLKKDKAIAANETNIELLTTEAKLQKEKLRQTRIVRNLTYGLAALLLVIVGLLVNSFRLKQRANKKLQLQQGAIEEQNGTLQHLVNEKDWLVKEIHHRVKNNLQIVMSLLESQSVYIDNEPALTAIHDSQHRVYAMSLIHQKLYNTDNLSSIDLSVYIRELTSYLADSFNTGQRIRFELNIEPLAMDVGQAVPLGLILNEAITNAIKYAFPNNNEGIIKINLSTISGNHYLLEISDNGVGMPTDLNNKKAGSLGMSLIAGLSEDLDGNFSIENKNGAVIKISFVHTVHVTQPSLLTASLTNN